MQGQELSRHNVDLGILGVWRRILLVGIPVTGILFISNIYTLLNFSMSTEQYGGVFITLILASIFLHFPARKQAVRDRAPWYDYILSFASFAPGIYIAIFYHTALLELARPTPERIVLGMIMILLTLEALRRVFGWVLTILPAFFIFYAAYTYLFPGFLHGKGNPSAWLVTYLYLDSSSFMYLVNIASTLILAFILFGNIIFQFRGGAVLGDLALTIGGRFRGGPAKVGVVGASLFGTISGSATANLLVVGPTVIPLMMKAGFKPLKAGGLCVVACTGGMITPPVMGVTAFVLADIVGVSYTTVALAAFIPAFLYYVSLFTQIDLEAAKMGMRRGLSREELPPLIPLLRKSWMFAVPLGILVYMMFIKGMHPTTAALYSGGLSLIVLGLAKENRMQFWRRLLAALEESGKNLRTIGVLLIGAGFMIAGIAASGLAFKISMSLIRMGGDNTLFLLFVSAAAALVLGLSLTITATYVIVAVLVTPALVEAGIPLLSAHLFMLYYANLAEISPPVSLTSFIAGPLTGCSPVAIGWEAMRLAYIAYIVPFLFVLTPTLLLNGSLWQILADIGTSMLGVFAFGIALVGYSFKAVSLVKRVLMGLSAVVLFVSIALGFAPLGVVLRLVVGLVTTFQVLWDWRKSKKP